MLFFTTWKLISLNFGQLATARRICLRMKALVRSRLAGPVSSGVPQLSAHFKIKKMIGEMAELSTMKRLAEPL
jgi:hypothetical protein